MKLKALNAVDLHKMLGKIIAKNSEQPSSDFDINLNCPIVLTVGSDHESPEYDEFYIYSIGGSDEHDGVVLSITSDPNIII